MQFSKSNFSEWFTDVLSEAGIMDIRYPVKGMPVYMPWGFAILRKIFSYLEGQLEDAGHEQALFPLLLTDNLLAKESHMLEGFSPEVFWVDAEDDGRKLAIRPTSETIMYTMYSLWVQSYKDLPLRIHQTVTCYRQETKATRPLIR
ncbi:proline--tRNA ligase, partial [Candidatus Micrarchaeota archaeon CG06_land_8_20_14_3_00_50_6]